MKKKLIILFISLVLTITACNTDVTKYEEDEKILWNKFVVIEKRTNNEYGCIYLAYDKDTLVEYYITYTKGCYLAVSSPVYNADGTIKVYDKEDEE